MQELGEHDCFPDTGASQEPDLPAAKKRTEKIDYLDACFQNFLLHGYIAIIRGLPVYGKNRIALDRTLAVKRRTRKINDAAQKPFVRGNRNRHTGIRYNRSALERARKR